MIENKQKQISQWLFKLNFSILVEHSGRLVKSLIFYWLAVWVTALVLIYILQIPPEFWKYANPVILISGLGLFLYHKRREISVFLNKSVRQRTSILYLIENLPHKRDYLIYDDFKTKLTQNSVFIKAAFKQLLDQQQISDFKKILSARKTPFLIYKFLLNIVFMGIILFFSVSSTGKVNHFWLYPFTPYMEPAPVKFYDLLEKNKIFEGDSVIFKVLISGEKTEKLWFEIEESKTGTITRHKLHSVAENDSVYISKPVTISENIRYKYYALLNGFMAGKNIYSSDVYSAEFIELPDLTGLEFTLISPPYTGLENHYFLEDQTHINCYPGSKLIVSGKLNGIAQEVNAFWGSSEMNRAINSDVFDFELDILQSQELTFSYTVFDTIYINYPVVYRINLLEDEYPVIQLLSPQGKIDLGSNFKVGVKLKVMDDFGLIRMKMYKKRYAENMDTIHTEVDVSHWLKPGSLFTIEQMLDFEEEYLLPGEQLDIYFEIFDNDIISGYKSAVSEQFTITIPTFQKLVAEVSGNFEQSVKETDELFDKTQKIQSEMDKIQRELKQNKDLSWEQKQAISEQIRQAQNMEKEIREIQDQIESNLALMEKNDLISLETLQKYFDLQQMFEKLLDSEFFKNMKKLEDMLDGKSAKEMEELISQSDFSIEDFEKEIERVHEPFKKVEMERKLDELVQLNKKINKDQERNFHSVNKNRNFTPVKNRQIQIVHDEMFLEKAIQDMLEKTSHQQAELKNNLENVNSFQEKKKILKHMEQLQQSAQSEDESGFTETYSQTMPDLQQRLNMLQQLKKDFIEQEKNKTKSKINYIIEEMLVLSNQQELLNQNFKKLSRFSAKIEKLAVEQMMLRKLLLHEIEKIVSLSHETFFLPMLLNQPLANAHLNMQRIISLLEERRTYQTQKHSDDIMKNLNQVIAMLLQTQNAINQSQSGTGIENFMKQMQQLAGMQSGVNQKTMQMMQKGQQGQMPGSGDPRMMAELAAQQQAIQRSLKQLGKGMNEGMGRGKSQIEKMSEEIKKIVDDLERRRIDRKTVNRQEKVLSRMLDASRSIHQKDQSEKRKAEMAGEFTINDPGPLGDEINYRSIIQEEYEKALQQDLSPEIKKMIKAYYEKLLEQSKN